MNILILGAAGFIGTNLAIKLADNKSDKVTLVDKDANYFSNILKYEFSNVEIKESSLDENEDFSILKGQDVVYHLVSTNIPTTSNLHISQDIKANVLFSSNLKHVLDIELKKLFLSLLVEPFTEKSQSVHYLRVHQQILYHPMEFRR